MACFGGKRRGNQFREFFHTNIRQDFLSDWLVEEGDFLVRKSDSGEWILSVKWGGVINNVKPACDGEMYSFGRKSFNSFDDLVHYHFKKRKSVGDSEAKLLKPIKHGFGVYDDGDIQTVTELGHGNFGQVLKVMIPSENQVAAMKVLLDGADDNAKDDFLKEKQLLLTMNHKNVVRCLGIVGIPPDEKFILEFLNRGTLEHLAKSRLTERVKSGFMFDVSSGMQYLHSHNVLHRDLAARNVLVHRNDDNTQTAKVCDFGLSQISHSKHGYKLTTPQIVPFKWMAPECFNVSRWMKASDVWSFGVLMWEVWSNGADPYGDIEVCATTEGLIEFIQNGGHPSDLSEVRPGVKEIMHKCWAKSSRRRPNMHDLGENFLPLR